MKKYLKTYENFEPEEEWEEEFDEIFIFDHPIHNRGDIPFNEGDMVYAEISNKYRSVQGLFKISLISQNRGNKQFLKLTNGESEWYIMGVNNKAKIKLKNINESFEPEEYWEEENDNPIPEELESFLKDNNCYEEYVEAADSEYSSTIRNIWNVPSDLNKFYEKVDRMNWISYCFKWSKTPSGDEIWGDIDSGWRRHLYRMNESFEPEEEWVEENEILDINELKRGEIYFIKRDDGLEFIFRFYSIRKNINIHNPDIIEYRIRSMSFVSSRNYYSINRKFVIHTPKNKPNYTLRYPTKYELNKFKYCERNLHHNENIPPTSLYFINELGI